MPSRSGFTLIELLVALTIFALIGAGSATMLQSVLRAREGEQERSEALARLQKAVWMIEQDAVQAIPGSFTAQGELKVRFRRAGWRNPAGLPRSDIAYVGYALNDQRLVRYYGRTADAMEPQPLLDNVGDFAFRALTTHTVEMTMDVKPYGTIRRVVEVAQP